MQATIAPERVLKVSEVAQHLHCDTTTVYRLIHGGEIRHLRVGRLIRIPESALTEFIDNAATSSEGK